MLVWGANWPIMKLGIEHIQPLWFACLRLALGAASLFLLLVPLGRIRLPSRADLPVVASVGLLQMALFMALVNLALQWVPPGRSAILAYTTPLWVAPGAALVLGERLSRGRLAGMALGLGGVAVLFGPQDFDWSKPQALAGNGMLLLAALVWAVTIVHIRGHRWRAAPLDLAPWQMILGLAPLAAVAWVVEGPPRADTSTEFLAVAAYNGPFATAFAFWAVVTVNRRLPALSVSLALLCVPAAGLLFSAAITGEAVSMGELLGLGLIAAGVGVVAVDSLRCPRSGEVP